VKIIKKLLLTVAVIVVYRGSFAQTTNTFPSSGNVGIGATNPTRQLEVVSGAGVGPLKAAGPNGYLLIDNVGSGESYYQANSFHQFQGSSGTPLMTIFNNGNVGIGAPSAYSGTPSTYSTLTVGSTDATAFITPGGPNTHLSLQTVGANGAIRFFTIGGSTNNVAPTESMRISAGGNVGIGTTNPTDLLTLNAGANRKGITIASDGDVSAYADFILAINSTGSVATSQPFDWHISHRKDGYFTGTPAGNSSLEFYADLKGGGYYAPLSFKADGNVVLVSNQNALGGNVLIGKTSQTNSSYKLDVNGNARANGIVVNTTGADFVFNDKYALRKLSEVKSYIDQNHHLPEIPSAEQMKKDGLNVGEMNTKLLQKIEELTLYLIDKDKQVMQLKSQVEQLQNQAKQVKSDEETRIAALEAALAKLTAGK
jgi:hypothetical protein